MSDRSSGFPNIELPPNAQAFGAVLASLAATRPDLIDAWRESVGTLIPEMASLLQKRNDTPAAITDADRLRMLEINTRIMAALDDLLNSQN